MVFVITCRSTSSALLKFTDDILNNMEHGTVSGVVYLDLKKAFDTVNHSILLRKMKATGVDDFSIKWFKSYLNNRTQRTVLGNAISFSRIVTTGVPQGSVLGPLLFLVYINDLTERLNHSVASLFADDTAIYCSATSTQELQRKLNEDLCGIKDLLNSHKLALNTTKSKFMVIGGTQRLNGLENLNIVIDEELLDRVDQFKYLGVVINKNLTWTDDIDHIQAKIIQRLGILKRVKYLLPIYSRKLVYNTTILPLFYYGDIVWADRCNNTLMDRIQLLQNMSVKIILDMPKQSSSSLALERLKWKPLKERRLYHRSAFVFKVFNKMIDFQLDNISNSQVHSYETRFRNNRVLPLCKTNWGQCKSNFLFIKEWNILSYYVKSSSSFNAFKVNYWKSLNN